MADKRDYFLINLNNCRTEINTKFKQISDNLVIRQNQLLSELDGIEKKYSESRNAENLLKPTKEYRIELNKGLQGSFLPENIISSIKVTIATLDFQIAELKQKLVAFTNIDIVLDTDSINTLIDKLGSVKLTEDSIASIPETGLSDSQSSSYKQSTPFNLNKNECQKNKVTAPNQYVGNSVASIPEMGLSDSQSSSYKQSMVQYNTPFNLYKNGCQINNVTAPNQYVNNIIMSKLQTCYIRDNFLIKLNNCRIEIDSKFKQTSDNLLIRQNQLLSELNGIEKKYLKSRNAEGVLKQAEKYRNDQYEGLQGSFSTENIISPIKLIIEDLDVQIADLRKKLVTFTNIDIELDTDNINFLIDKLGYVKLTEDSEYNPYVDYITDMCDIDPCESYNPFNKNSNNTIVCTAALRNKNTIHNAEADTPVTPIRGRNKRRNIFLPDTTYYSPGEEVAALDQDVNYHSSKLGFFCQISQLA